MLYSCLNVVKHYKILVLGHPVYSVRCIILIFRFIILCDAVPQIHCFLLFRKWRQNSIITTSWWSWKRRDMMDSSVQSPEPEPCPSQTGNTWTDVQYSTRPKSTYNRFFTFPAWSCSYEFSVLPDWTRQLITNTWTNACCPWSIAFWWWKSQTTFFQLLCLLFSSYRY